MLDVKWFANAKYVLLAWTKFDPSVGKLSHAHPDSKFHGANMGAIWGRQDPGGPHVGLMNFAIWTVMCGVKLHVH